MLLMRMLKQNHIKLVIILFLNDEAQTNLYLYIRKSVVIFYNYRIFTLHGINKCLLSSSANLHEYRL
jgi:hypothetical protein